MNESGRGSIGDSSLGETPQAEGEHPRHGDRLVERVQSLTRRPVTWFLVLLVAALLPRILTATHRSLWLDEFHTLYHSQVEEVGTLVDNLRADNHPPLYFLGLRAVLPLVGSSELGLRLLSIGFGLWCVFLCARLARGLRGSWAPGLAPLLLCFSSLHIIVSAEARMYSLLALVVAGLLLALQNACAGRRAWLAAFLWCVVGLHTHYFFFHYLGILCLTSVFLAWKHPGTRSGLLRAWGGVLAALLVSLPWYLLVFRDQLSHGLLPGGRTISPLHVLETFVHLMFINVRIAGEIPRVHFIVAGIVGVLLASWTVLRLLRGKLDEEESQSVTLLAAVSFGMPVWAAISVLFFERSGYNWTYLAGCSAPFAILVCAHSPRSRASLDRVLIVLALAAVLSVLIGFSRGTEPYRDAVAHILDRHREGDAVVVVEPGPEVFPPALGWQYYSTRLSGAEGPPERLAMKSHFHLEGVADLEGYERVWLFERGLRDTDWMIVTLRERFAGELIERFGYGLFVHAFSAPRAPADQKAPSSRG